MAEATSYGVRRTRVLRTGYFFIGTGSGTPDDAHDLRDRKFRRLPQFCAGKNDILLAKAVRVPEEAHYLTIVVTLWTSIYVITELRNYDL
jgi:hypothetical protein